MSTCCHVSFFDHARTSQGRSSGRAKSRPRRYNDLGLPGLRREGWPNRDRSKSWPCSFMLISSIMKKYSRVIIRPARHLEYWPIPGSLKAGKCKTKLWHWIGRHIGFMLIRTGHTWLIFVFLGNQNLCIDTQILFLRGLVLKLLHI